MIVNRRGSVGKWREMINSVEKFCLYINNEYFNFRVGTRFASATRGVKIRQYFHPI
jgi:hypothetical protein